MNTRVESDNFVISNRKIYEKVDGDVSQIATIRLHDKHTLHHMDADQMREIATLLDRLDSSVEP